MKRIYDRLLEEHLVKYEQMAFLAGPRQVGKTTIAQNAIQSSKYSKYLNWDNIDSRKIILSGNQSIVENLPIATIPNVKPFIIFDELHKYKNWKTLLKGFVDEYKLTSHIIVTGSAKLDVYRKGGDSLMGRYFLYRVCPLSVAEIVRGYYAEDVISSPSEVENDLISSLLEFGGFPESFLKQDKRFHNRWQNMRFQQLMREDIMDLAKIQELAQLEVLADLLKYQTGQMISYTNLSNKVRVNDTTIRRWISTLESFYYCFRLRPWSSNVSRSLLKEPKLYLMDWSVIEDKGARIENFVACHLYKAVNFWNDAGFGKYDLFFLRDKEKREVDFLITANNKPWIMIEVKSSNNCSLNKNLLHFQKQINAEHVLQLSRDLPYIEQDFRESKSPQIFPMSTFLSQMV
ncbi:MAG: ATP-binding protein [Rickettsiales bacterium]|jgi:predicted AAA+ superfamily ATPase|nr:ATP-binding protein [Rickettsiales bacterium]